MSATWLVLLPALAALAALCLGGLAWKLAVAGLCAAVVAGRGWIPTAGASPRGRGSMLCGFLFAMAGDFFLATRPGHPGRFESGIVCFLVAHLAFLAFALRHGRMRWSAFFALLGLLFPYFILGIRPRLPDANLGIAVFSYLVVSCAGFGAAMGVDLGGRATAWYRVGIGLLLFSDTLISLGEFLGWRRMAFLVLPTYYLFLVAVLAAWLDCGRARAAAAAPAQEPGGGSAH